MQSGTPVSPPAAQSASQFLRRVGFIVLAMAPLFSQFSRRGFVIVMPLGAILLILARMIETDGQEPLAGMRNRLGHVCAWPILFFIGWAGLSLIWTPFAAEAAIRYVNLMALSLLLFATIQSLGDHTRIANLNLLPIGLACSLGIALALNWTGLANTNAATDTTMTERLPVLTVILMIPASTWLLSRGRWLVWMGITATACLTLLLQEAVTAVIALSVSLGIYGLTLVRPAWSRLLTLISTAMLVLMAPLLPFLLRPVTKFLYGSGDLTMDALRAWGRLVQKEPLRLLTGHGFDVSMRAKIAGLIEAAAPRGLLFEIWYELGFLGVLSLVLLFIAAIRYARHQPPHIAASILSSLMACFIFAVAGQASMQAWWLTLIGLLMIHLVAIAHGQFHTQRPISQSPMGRPQATRPIL
jgi:hypothetical protein